MKEDEKCVSIFGTVPDDAELIAVSEDEDEDEESFVEIISTSEARRINKKWQKSTGLAQS
jgi:hypothetical protein